MNNGEFVDEPLRTMQKPKKKSRRYKTSPLSLNQTEESTDNEETKAKRSTNNGEAKVKRPEDDGEGKVKRLTDNGESKSKRLTDNEESKSKRSETQEPSERQVELKELSKETRKDELQLRRISSTSIRTNSNILNDVLCDLSSISSETVQTNIELSDLDKQRINQFKERQKELKSRSSDFKSFRKRFMFDVSYFKTCSFYKQLVILILSVLTLFDCGFILNGKSSSSNS